MRPTFQSNIPSSSAGMNKVFPQTSVKSSQSTKTTQENVTMTSSYMIDFIFGIDPQFLSHRKGSYGSWHRSLAVHLTWGQSCTTMTPGWNSLIWTLRKPPVDCKIWTLTVSSNPHSCPIAHHPFLASEMMTRVELAVVTLIFPVNQRPQLSIQSSQVKSSIKHFAQQDVRAQVCWTRPLMWARLKPWTERPCIPKWVKWGQLARCYCLPSWRKSAAAAKACH